MTMCSNNILRSWPLWHRSGYAYGGILQIYSICLSTWWPYDQNHQF